MRRLLRVLARVWHRHNISLLCEAIAEEHRHYERHEARIRTWSHMLAEHRGELALLEGRQSRLSPWLAGPGRRA